MDIPMPPCLYCKREDRRFTSEEHVVPESLGNREIVLPKGVVCDKCNNEKLSTLDQTLVNFMPVSARKTMVGIPSKTGALPKGTYGNASINMFAPGNVKFDSNSREAFGVTPLGDGTNRVKIDMKLLSNRPMGAKYCRKLTRSLLKMLLGCIYIDHGHDFALSERFDPLRDKILERTKFKGYFAMMRKMEAPDSQSVGLLYDFFTLDGIESAWAEFQFYGVSMCTDSEMLALKHRTQFPEDQLLVFTF
jgi:hypothetical protein